MTPEAARHRGIFHTWDNLHYSTEELRDVFDYWQKKPGRDPGTFSPTELEMILDGLCNYQKCPNIIMATQKLRMANAVYPNIDRLVITSQTSSPSDTETSYSGEIYTSVASDEFYRSGNANPYQVGFNILNDAANGNWGSFILITSTGEMINRALSGVTKSAGTSKLVMFTGSVL